MAVIYGTSASQTLRGSGFDDQIYGLAGNDLLYGYGGHDTLNGGTGADTMRGGLGDDTYFVDNPSDSVVELAGEGLDTVRASTSFALAAGSSIERLTTSNSLSTVALDLIGNEISNTIRGNAGRNAINGEAGNDTLAGLSGDDVLLGGAGRDRLIGGPGYDTFVFTDRSSDRIDDFESGVDTIDLGWLMTYDQFEFIGTAAFSGSPGEGRYSNSVFQLDLNGDAIADLTLTIFGTLAATDFDFAARGYWDY